MAKEKGVLANFYFLWVSQSISQLGSAITSFALTLLIFEKTGSELSASLMLFSSYLPFFVTNFFAGAITDKFDKKRVMLVCDSLAALATLCIFAIYKTDCLLLWHLYVLNLFENIMNAVQMPTSSVAVSMIITKEYYQKTSGLQVFSRFTIIILSPVISAYIYSNSGLDVIFALDIATFVIASLTLIFLVKIPPLRKNREVKILTLVEKGAQYIKENPLNIMLIIIAGSLNLLASIFQTALSVYAMQGGENFSEYISSVLIGAMVFGGLTAAILPKPKDRIKTIYYSILFPKTLGFFIFAFSREPALWFIASVLIWFSSPVIIANIDTIINLTVPTEMQGRVLSIKNAIQYITVPLGLILGEFLVNSIFEPLMVKNNNAFTAFLFGTGQGAGSALLMMVLGILNVVLCMSVRNNLISFGTSALSGLED